MSETVVVSPRKAGSADATIPRQDPFGSDYKTWSLFLVCTPTWFTKNTDPRLLDLYRNFAAFGRAIGPDHLAVWFARSDKTELTPRMLASEYDSDRAAKFCRQYGLSPRTAPHVVVTREYPDPERASGNYLTLSLGNADAATTGKLLLALTEQIWSAEPSQRALTDAEWWHWVEQMLRTWIATASPLFNRLRVKLNAPPFLKVELTPAKSARGSSRA
jgi:hypothetical protein